MAHLSTRLPVRAGSCLCSHLPACASFRLAPMPRRTLIAAFGEPFQLSAPSTLRKSAADEWAAEQVMSRIAALLPLELRGAYRSHVEPIAAS